MLRRCFLVAVVALGSGARTHADLVVNGGFETGDLTGWNVEAFASGAAVAASPIMPLEGSYDLQYISSPSSPAVINYSAPDVTISQNIATVPFKQYEIDIFLSDTDTGNYHPAGDLAYLVQWGNSIIGGGDFTGSIGGDWSHAIIIPEATASATTFSIKLWANAGLGIAIDNVSVTQLDSLPSVPEPSTALPAIAAGVLCLCGGWRRR